MADNEKPTGQAIIHDVQRSIPRAEQSPPPPMRPQVRDRFGDELKPLAKRVADNPDIMRRFEQARGSDNEDLAREVVDEIRNYARSLDPTIGYVEGATIVLLLEEMFPRKF